MPLGHGQLLLFFLLLLSGLLPHIPTTFRQILLIRSLDLVICRPGMSCQACDWLGLGFLSKLFVLSFLMRVLEYVGIWYWFGGKLHLDFGNGHRCLSQSLWFGLSCNGLGFLSHRSSYFGFSFWCKFNGLDLLLGLSVNRLRLLRRGRGRLCTLFFDCLWLHFLIILRWSYRSLRFKDLWRFCPLKVFKFF